MPLTDPAVTIASVGMGPGGEVGPVSMTNAQLDAMFTNSSSSSSGKTVGNFANEEAKGYILQGKLYANGAGGEMPCTLAYYTVGGSSGTGYLYVVGRDDVTSTNDTLQRALAHMMGCLSPADVKYAGLTSDLLGGFSSSTSTTTGQTTYSGNLYDIPNVQRTLLVSLSGVSFKMEFSFSQGMVTITLCYAAVKPTEEVMEDAASALSLTGSEANQQQIYDALIKAMDEAATDTSSDTDVAQTAAVQQKVPYIVVPI